MIGTTIAIGAKAKYIKDVATLKESWHQCENVVSTKELHVSYTFYDGYPIYEWMHNEYNILFEGAIYNYNDEYVKKKLEQIVNSDFDKQEVLEFISSADGDYCVYFFNKKINRVVAFNDILGGIPLFFANVNDTFYLSRQFGLILSNLDDKKWDSKSIAEFLTYGFNIRERTFSKDISKMEPASMVDVKFDEKISFSYITIYKENFLLNERFKSKEEAISELSKLFLESCKNRVNYALSHGYKIINTISGGFDSRTVVGGVEKFTNDYTNITYEYIQDESPIAKGVLETIGSKSSYLKLNFKNNPDCYNNELTCNTDGRINVFTNSICYHDMLSVRHEFGNSRILYFGGFGGEFIRHPKYKSFMPFSKLGLSYSPTYFVSSKICNVSIESLEVLFSNSFCQDINNREAKYKDYYNEYYQNLVRCSGEDRTRMFYFTVQPLMGKDFIMAIRHRVPLRWVGFKFYKDFLETIDTRLTSVNIFGQEDNYLNSSNLKKLDFKKRVIEYYISPLRFLAYKFTNKEFSNSREVIDRDSVCECLKACDSLNLFNSEFIINNYGKLHTKLQYTLFAVLSYIKEKEK